MKIMFKVRKIALLHHWDNKECKFNVDIFFLKKVYFK